LTAIGEGQTHDSSPGKLSLTLLAPRAIAGDPQSADRSVQSVDLKATTVFQVEWKSGFDLLRENFVWAKIQTHQGRNTAGFYSKL